MSPRLILNIIITGVSVFGRAFTEAYKQAAKASAAKTFRNDQTPKQSTIGGISLEESLKILNITKDELTEEILKKQFEHLFDINSKEKGNSFYLQSKIYFALETLKKYLKDQKNKSTKI